MANDFETGIVSASPQRLETTTTLRAEVIAAIVAHARTARPAECCGVLLGRGDLVEEARPARNMAERPTSRFVIDPKDHFDAIREARRRDLGVVGFYHSHTRSPAEPSETDLAEAASFEHLHVIVSLASDPPDLRLFYLADGAFRERPFVTIGRMTGLSPASPNQP